MYLEACVDPHIDEQESHSRSVEVLEKETQDLKLIED